MVLGALYLRKDITGIRAGPMRIRGYWIGSLGLIIFLVLIPTFK